MASLFLGRCAKMNFTLCQTNNNAYIYTLKHIITKKNYEYQ
jgi:hypothetical protein